MAVIVKLEAVDLQVEAGSEASLSIEVTNTGTIVEQFEIAVVGAIAPWASVDPPALNLDAGVTPGSEFDSSNLTDRAAAATGTARITFRIPRAPSPLADTYDFAVHVRATADQTVAKVEEGRITVLPFVALQTEIVPETSRGSLSGGHQLSVANRGNIAAEVSVRAVQVNRELGFQVVPPLVGVAPDKDASVRIRAKPKDTFLLGPSKQVPFQVKIDEPLAGSSSIPAYLDQRAIIPSWVKPLGGLAIAALAIVLVGPTILSGMGINIGPTQAADNPSPSAPPPTPEVTLPTPTPLGPPSDPPTPTPPPIGGLPDELRVIGDDDDLNESQGLLLNCPSQDNDCRKIVRELIRFNLQNLHGTASGGLTNFKDAPPGTLPLLAKWTTSVFEFRAVDPVTNLEKLGQTERIRIDLAPILVGAPGYVLIDDLAGPAVYRYVLDPADGAALFSKLYAKQELPTPAPIPTGGFNFDPDVLRELAGNNAWVVNFQFVLP